MTPAPVSASVQLIPSRTMRAGMLAYISALAAIEVSDGVIVAEAWREQRHRAVVHAEELKVFGEMFDRLRAIEAVVAVGAVVTTVLWSFIAVRNASTACRNGRSGATAVLSWTAAPIAVLLLAGFRNGTPLQSNGVLAAQAVVMLIPFATIGVAAKRVGGAMAPFVRWYIALALTFLVHEAFTGTFNLADPKPSNDLGRAAALMLASALALGLMVLMAADAAKSMELATLDRMQAHRDWRAEALQRFRSAVAPAARPVPVQPPREDALVMVAAVPTMAPRSATLEAQPAVAPVQPQMVQPQIVQPQIVQPQIVQPQIVQPAAPAGNSMFAPLAVRTFPTEAPAPAATPQPATVEPSAVQPTPAAPAPAAAEPVVADPPPATGSPFAPLQPRSTPRSI